MIGYPKYTYNDIVVFTINGQDMCGIIAVVDIYGTFCDDSDVQYDIMVRDENTIYKHIHEKSIKRKVGFNEEGQY